MQSPVAARKSQSLISIDINSVSPVSFTAPPAMSTTGRVVGAVSSVKSRISVVSDRKGATGSNEDTGAADRYYLPTLRKTVMTMATTAKVSVSISTRSRELSWPAPPEPLRDTVAMLPRLPMTAAVAPASVT